MRKIGRKKGAFLLIIGVAVLKFLLEQLGENIFGSAYTEYIEPVITKKIYIVSQGKEALEEQKLLEIIEKNSFHVDLIILLIVAGVIIIGIALLCRRVYLYKNLKRNAQEESIIQAMKALVDDTDYILAAQLYRYRIDTVGRGKAKNKKIIIDHIGSNYNDGMDINAIVHEEFLVEGNYYRGVTQFLSRYWSSVKKKHKIK